MKGLQWVQAAITMVAYVKHQLCEDDILFLSLVILHGTILGPHVDQLVIVKPSLVDSNMMIQLCCHNWDVKTLQQCT